MDSEVACIVGGWTKSSIFSRPLKNSRIDVEFVRAEALYFWNIRRSLRHLIRFC